MSFVINQYEISARSENELLLLKMRSKKIGPAIAVTIFGGMGLFFLYLLFESANNEGWFLGNILLLGGFAALMLAISIGALIGYYFTTTSYHFTKDKLTIKEGIKRPTTIVRDSVSRIFIQKTLITEQSSGLSTDFTYSIMMKMKLSAKPRYLLGLENRDSLASIAGYLDSKGMDVAEEQAYKLALIISEFWDVEIKAKQPGSTFL